MAIKYRYLFLRLSLKNRVICIITDCKQGFKIFLVDFCCFSPILKVGVGESSPFLFKYLVYLRRGFMIYPGAHAALITPTAFLPFLSSPAPHTHTQTIKTTLHTHTSYVLPLHRYRIVTQIKTPACRLLVQLQVMT